MATWIFEPGHTAAEFCVRHMMVTWVRGHFKSVEGSLQFDPDDPVDLSLEATMSAAGIWSGEPHRDDHLRSSDFLEVANHPTITFKSNSSSRTGATHYEISGTLNIRGKNQPVVLDLQYLGKWQTPYNDARVTRLGFTGKTRINRHDFGASWNSSMANGGSVVGDDVFITIDVEAILETDLRPILEQSATARA